MECVLVSPGLHVVGLAVFFCTNTNNNIGNIIESIIKHCICIYDKIARVERSSCVPVSSWHKLPFPPVTMKGTQSLRVTMIGGMEYLWTLRTLRSLYVPTSASVALWWSMAVGANLSRLVQRVLNLLPGLVHSQFSRNKEEKLNDVFPSPHIKQRRNKMI